VLFGDRKGLLESTSIMSVYIGYEL